jgi:predicted Rossmann fold nucleotide-binding protein DprA/Smf involved in DNA uptake
LDELNLVAPKEIIKARKILPRNADEKILFEILNKEPMHIDQIGKTANLPQAKISSILTLMEIEGKVRHLGGMIYKLNI